MNLTRNPSPYKHMGEDVAHFVFVSSSDVFPIVRIRMLVGLRSSQAHGLGELVKSRLRQARKLARSLARVLVGSQACGLDCFLICWFAAPRDRGTLAHEFAVPMVQWDYSYLPSPDLRIYM